MITILARKHIRYDAEGRDVCRIFIAVASASELPASQTAIDRINFTEASRAWDVSTGDKYGYVVGQGWKKQATVINPMTLKGRVDTVADLDNIQDPQPGWVYFVGLETDTEFMEYVYIEDSWQFLGYNNIVIDSVLSDSSENPVQNKVITLALGGKVNTEVGKGLSTEDYTTAEKNKLAGLSNYDDTEVRGLIATKADASILTPISESAYEALVTKDKPLYFIYD